MFDETSERTGRGARNVSSVLRMGISLAALAAAISCGSTTPGEMAYWSEGVSGEGTQFTVTAREPAGSDVELTRRVLDTKARRLVVQTAVDQILADFGTPSSAVDTTALTQRILSQANDYVSAFTRIDHRHAGGELAVKAHATLDRAKLKENLAKYGFLRNQHLRTIIVFRDLRATGADDTTFDTGHLHDFSENMSRAMVDRGFEPKLWQDVRLQVAHVLDRGDAAFQSLLINYVEGSDWREAKDERYALPMLLLRTQGRMLIGVSILELKRSDLTWNSTLRADIFDLFNRRSLGALTKSGSMGLGSQTHTEARQRLVMETTSKLIAEVCDSLQEAVIQENNLRRQDYSMRFVGFSKPERDRIEEYAIAVLQEDATSSDDGQILELSASVPRDPVPVRQEMSQLLDLIGCSAHPPDRRGHEMVFTKSAR